MPSHSSRRDQAPEAEPDRRPYSAEPALVVPLLGEAAGVLGRPSEEVGEPRLRGLVDALPDGLVIADDEGRIVYANRQLEEMSGYSAAELRGMHIEALVPERMRPLHERHRGRYLSQPSLRPMGAGLQIVLLRKDGGEIPVDISLSPLDTPGTRVVLAAVRDVTDRREAEERLRHSEEGFRQVSARLEAINDVARAILESREPVDVLQIVATRGRRLVEADSGMIITPAEPGSLMVRVTDGEAAAHLNGAVIPADQSLAGEAMRSRRPLVVEDVATSSPAPPEIAGTVPLGAGLFVPLATDERLYGILVAANRRGGAPFSDEDLRSLELFAAQASIALEHGRIRGELQRLAIVEDRERIARELHDGSVQALFAVGLGLLSVEPLAAEDPVRGRIHEAVDSIDKVIADLRRYIFGLRPQAVGLETLGHAVETLALEFQARTGVVTAVDVDHRLDRHDARTGEVIQVAREALSNVARHAAATTCRVSLRWESAGAVLEIDDDGRGFDQGTVPGHGYGLDNLRERAKAIGGSLDITTQPGQGTTIRLGFPADLEEALTH
ncbi:MAG TPA: PAS domain S-box protein [Candidatus Dormibacteraeota bacterium]|jgi:PAS domain S-box-containing protein|nr:PAS domain S-box protein [Candidatus Dormibacteraeota bacterium]